MWTRMINISYYDTLKNNLPSRQINLILHSCRKRKNIIGHPCIKFFDIEIFMIWKKESKNSLKLSCW